MSTRVNSIEENKIERDFSMPMEWLHVLTHSTTKDKPSLLLKLKYEMTIADVHDLIEYQQYENWVNYEDYLKNNKQGF